MMWKTAVKLVGDEADDYLNQLDRDRWLIKDPTVLLHPETGSVFVGIVACQSPAYAKKGTRP